MALKKDYWRRQDGGWYLKGTSIYITRERRAGNYHYTLHDGDGRIDHKTATLTELKRLGEQIAGINGEKPKDSAAMVKWQKNNTVHYGFRLNRADDWRIIEILEHTGNKQGIIKQALAEYVKKYF